MPRTHITVLETTALRCPSAVAFKVPRSTGLWQDITYQQFLDDVVSTAMHWTRVFRQSAIPEGSVVGLWWVSFSSLAFWL